jgi:hypothetical protein
MTDGSDSEGHCSDKSSSPNSVVTVVPWSENINALTLVENNDLINQQPYISSPNM